VSLRHRRDVLESKESELLNVIRLVGLGCDVTQDGDPFRLAVRTSEQERLVYE
jgi:hypothetical protein